MRHILHTAATAIDSEPTAAMRAGNYNGAVALITTRVASVIAQDAGVTLTNAPAVAPQPGPSPGISIGGIVLLIIVIVIVLATPFGRLLLWGLLLGGGGGRGSGYGGGSWGGGGFGGGGVLGVSGMRPLSDGSLSRSS